MSNSKSIKQCPSVCPSVENTLTFEQLKINEQTWCQIACSYPKQFGIEIQHNRFSRTRAMNQNVEPPPKKIDNFVTKTNINGRIMHGMR